MSSEPIIAPPAVHVTEPMIEPKGPPPEGDITAPEGVEAETKTISAADRQKLGRAALELYLVGISFFDRDVSTECRDNKRWYEDSCDVVAEILIEDFGIYDLKEVRWIRAGVLLAPPAIKAYKSYDAKKTETRKKEIGKHERRKEEENYQGDEKGGQGAMEPDPKRKVRRRRKKSVPD